MTAPPSSATHRLQNVDALRGFALLGILAVNIWAFADPFYASSMTNPRYDGGLDHVIRLLVILLFETKFYLLFSFLFGYSFTLQMAAAERANERFVPRMARRQLGLLVIGILHGVLLYYGEILALYALLGSVLILCRAWPPRRAIRAGVVLIVIAALVWIGLGLLAILSGDLVGNGDAPPEVIAKLAAFGGSAGQTLTYHAGHWSQTFLVLVVLQAPSAMAMFLLGYAAGRVQVFARLDRFRPLGRRLLRIGLPVGVIGATAYALAASFAPGGGVEAILFGLGQLTAPLLTASYVIGMLAWFRSARGSRIEAALAPMGKIALTNYLLQSAVLGMIFTGYGFGLIDRLPPIAVVALVPVIFGGQMAFSRWWLRGHVYGPAEWVLRAITIGRFPAWRIGPRVESGRRGDGKAGGTLSS